MRNDVRTVSADFLERLTDLGPDAEHLPEPISCDLLTLVREARAALTNHPTAQVTDAMVERAYVAAKADGLTGTSGDCRKFVKLILEAAMLTTPSVQVSEAVGASAAVQALVDAAREAERDMGRDGYAWESSRDELLKAKATVLAMLTTSPRETEGDLAEQIAQWLHDETDHPDSYPNYTWPEHPDDTGQRDGGWVKIVPKDAQARFREIATRLALNFPLAAPTRHEGKLVEALVSASQALLDQINEEGPPAQEWQAIGKQMDAVSEALDALASTAGPTHE